MGERRCGVSENENTTVSDVTARMRTEAGILALLNGQSVGVASVVNKLREFADSIDAAVSKTETTAPVNAAAMREALKPFVSLGYWLIENAGKDALGEGISEMMPMLRKRIDAAESALAAPPRNCDVGTAEEQSERFKAFCNSHMYGFNDPRGYRCKEDCPVKMEICRSDKPCIYCRLVWAQMPYESEATA